MKKRRFINHVPLLVAASVKLTLLVIVLMSQSIFGSNASFSTFDAYMGFQTQQISVTGKVLDENGLPLPGANIIEKGTNNGVASDLDGNFSINVSDNSVILVISYIGYKPKEVLASTNLGTIQLELDASALDEIGGSNSRHSNL